MKELTTYIIDWQNGLRDTVTGTLEDTMREVDARLAYTQESVYIKTEDGAVVARRPWSPTLENIGESERPCPIGEGFYDDWMDDYGTCNYPS